MPILPRFFLVTTQSGVTSMSINFDGAKEVAVPVMGHPFAWTTTVECPNASWTFYYNNGYIVTLRGPLSATLSIVFTAPQPPPPTANGANGPVQPPAVPYSMAVRIDAISFNAEKHEKAVRVEAIQGMAVHRTRTPKMMSMKPDPSIAGGTAASASPGAVSTGTTIANSAESTPVMEHGHPPGNSVGSAANGGGDVMVISYERATIPLEPVNAFGIPQATMRCLEVRSCSPLFELKVSRSI